MQKGDVIISFTSKEAQKTTTEIYRQLDIPLNKLILTNIEIGVNIQISEDPMNYINTIRYYNKKYRFSPMKPLTKTNNIKDVFCEFSEYEIKLLNRHIVKMKLKE
ncbi:hypothetical protein [Dysgonomonas sp. ZJ709]|uniref:hypothetical protein n=1 Tax=Dysgonomonas sp. ZJ709 TaxID=2709797 RepID=UPI0013EB120B|nr:hypothetical protein [Dysgonomonas sp. ZJ709]